MFWMLFRSYKGWLQLELSSVCRYTNTQPGTVYKDRGRRKTVLSLYWYYTGQTMSLHWDGPGILSKFHWQKMISIDFYLQWQYANFQMRSYMISFRQSWLRKS